MRNAHFAGIRRVTWIGRLRVAALVASGWMMGTAACAADLVIAHVGPFTGPLAVNGEANYAGAKAYFDQVNAQGGIGGRKIRYVREDDAYKPEETIRLLKLVAERDKPLAFVNILGSANVTELLKARTLDQLEVPVVGVTPGSESLRTPGSPHLFHLQAGDRAQLNAILGHLSTIGITRVAVVYQDIPFGKTGHGFAEQLAGPKGVTVVGKVPLAAGSNDARTAAAEMRKLNAQTYLLILTPNSGAAFARDARNAGDATPIYGMSYVTAQGVVEQVGAGKAEGIGLAQVTPNPQSQATGLTRDFQSAMKAHAPQGTELSAMSLTGYIAARVTVEAIKRAGANPTPATVDAALRKLKVDLGNFQIDLSNGDNVGSRMVEIGVISRAGTLRY